MEESRVARRVPRRLRIVAAGWVVTRALVVWLYLDSQSWVTGDADYFASSLSSVPDVGLARTLVEYPLPGVAVLAFPWLVVSVLGMSDAYAEAVLVLSVLADAAFTVLLWSTGGRRRRAALTAWVLAVPLLGATAYARFDLVPGVLTGTALLLLVRRPRMAAAAAALATGLKLWPALVLPALAVPPSSPAAGGRRDPPDGCGVGRSEPRPRRLGAPGLTAGLAGRARTADRGRGGHTGDARLVPVAGAVRDPLRAQRLRDRRPRHPGPAGGLRGAVPARPRRAGLAVAPRRPEGAAGLGPRPSRGWPWRRSRRSW